MTYRPWDATSSDEWLPQQLRLRWGGDDGGGLGAGGDTTGGPGLGDESGGGVDFTGDVTGGATAGPGPDFTGDTGGGGGGSFTSSDFGPSGTGFDVASYYGGGPGSFDALTGGNIGDLSAYGPGGGGWGTTDGSYGYGYGGGGGPGYGYGGPGGGPGGGPAGGGPFGGPGFGDFISGPAFTGFDPSNPVADLLGPGGLENLAPPSPIGETPGIPTDPNSLAGQLGIQDIGRDIVQNMPIENLPPGMNINPLLDIPINELNMNPLSFPSPLVNPNEFGPPAPTGPFNTPTAPAPAPTMEMNDPAGRGPPLDLTPAPAYQGTQGLQGLLDQLNPISQAQAQTSLWDIDPLTGQFPTQTSPSPGWLAAQQQAGVINAPFGPNPLDVAPGRSYTANIDPSLYSPDLMGPQQTFGPNIAGPPAYTGVAPSGFSGAPAAGRDSETQGKSDLYGPPTQTAPQAFQNVNFDPMTLTAPDVPDLPGWFTAQEPNDVLNPAGRAMTESLFGQPGWAMPGMLQGLDPSMFAGRGYNVSPEFLTPELPSQLYTSSRGYDVDPQFLSPDPFGPPGAQGFKGDRGAVFDPAREALNEQGRDLLSRAFESPQGRDILQEQRAMQEQQQPPPAPNVPMPVANPLAPDVRSMPDIMMPPGVNRGIDPQDLGLILSRGQIEQAREQIMAPQRGTPERSAPLQVTVNPMSRGQTSQAGPFASRGGIQAQMDNLLAQARSAPTQAGRTAALDALNGLISHYGNPYAGRGITDPDINIRGGGPVYGTGIFRGR